MSYVGNVMSVQLRKLFQILQYSFMQNLRIFGVLESICFEFTSLS
jgi:hypothetical protein